jgi:hypothetical protein
MHPPAAAAATAAEPPPPPLLCVAQLVWLSSRPVVRGAPPPPPPPKHQTDIAARVFCVSRFSLIWVPGGAQPSSLELRLWTIEPQCGDGPGCVPRLAGKLAVPASGACPAGPRPGGGQVCAAGESLSRVATLLPLQFQ